MAQFEITEQQQNHNPESPAKLFTAAADIAMNNSNRCDLKSPPLETNLVSRCEGVKLPRASGKTPDFPGVPERIPRKFSHCGTSQQSTVSQTSPEVSRTSRPGGEPLSLGSLPGGQPFLWEA